VQAVYSTLQKESVMEVVTEGKTYLSPEYKLLAFFEKSRNRWKNKALQRKQQIRQLEKRVAALETSRRNWKEKAQAQRPKVVLNDDQNKKGTRA
jgi:hypothetical protein